MKYTEYNEDAGRNEFGTHLESESRKYSALQSLLAGKLRRSLKLPWQRPASANQISYKHDKGRKGCLLFHAVVL